MQTLCSALASSDYTSVLLRSTASKITRTQVVVVHVHHHHPRPPLLHPIAAVIKVTPETHTTAATTTTTTTTTKQLKVKEEEEQQRRRSSNSNSNSNSHRNSKSRRPPSLAATLCNAADELINNFIDPAVLRPSIDPGRVLSDNFAPVGELPPTPCPIVRGSIPACLGGGAYIRNGPNPQHLPRGPYHLFDGDGMLHSLLLAPGGGTAPALLCSRFVRTYRYLLERDAGAPLLPNTFSAFNGPAGLARGAVVAARILTGQMNPLEGAGLANTSLAFFGGRLYALGESDLPYAVHLAGDGDGELSTLGRSDFEGRLSMGMTAHPKKDPETGEVFAFRYGPVPPFLTYFRFDRAGNKLPDVPIFSLRQPAFLHDFAITRRYAVFGDIQIGMRPPLEMLLEGGAPVGSDRGKVPRIGVLPRYAESEAEMRWFEVPGFNMVHAVNAWEEEDALVLVAPNVLSVEHALERTELIHCCVERVRIDLRSGTVQRTPLSAENLDFGVIHPGYVGRPNRWAYLGIGDPMPNISGVVKLDLQSEGHRATVARRLFGPGCFGGEPFFVPAAEAEEDEGYLVSYVHDEGSGESRFVVMDARSPHLEVVAEVQLPRRVPYGFHGIFLTEKELRSQRAASASP